MVIQDGSQTIDDNGTAPSIEFVSGYNLISHTDILYICEGWKHDHGNITSNSRPKY